MKKSYYFSNNKKKCIWSHKSTYVYFVFLLNQRQINLKNGDPTTVVWGSFDPATILTPGNLVAGLKRRAIDNKTGGVKGIFSEGENFWAH